MALLHPEKLHPVRYDLQEFAGLAARTFEKEFDLLVVSGLRLEEEQQRIYAKGRTTSSGICVCPEHPLGLTVTEAEHARQTAHGCGDAIDCCPCVRGVPMWPHEKLPRQENERREAMFVRVGELAERHGMTWGGRWKKPRDLGHIEMADWKSFHVQRKG